MMLWSMIYILIGVLFASEGRPKKYSFKIILLYLIIIIAWPFIFLLIFIELADEAKKGGRQ